MRAPSKFRDRREAGRLLGEHVAYLKAERPIVLALARGGVPVAFEVARALDSPLDVLVVRKLGVPFHPELALGAIGEENAQVLNTPFVQGLGISSEAIAEVTARERVELLRRVALYRGNRPRLELVGRTVIIVDDGLATGATARVAVEIARARGATRVIVAVPVSPPEAAAEMATLADEVISLRTPRRFQAVGEWYEHFDQTDDDEVTSLLRNSKDAG
jgi:putative phosphoribosyl transferase